jgi:peptidoglycan/LPS O-acetylase OafA/YrhL
MQGGEKLAQVPAFVIRPLAWVGVLSYSLYLVHFPAFKLMGLAWQEVFGAKPGNFLVPLAATLAVIPLAWFLHRWVERPSHDLARRLARRGNSGNPA